MPFPLELTHLIEYTVPMNEIKYFGWWLGGDALHLTALLLEGAGSKQYKLSSGFSFLLTMVILP